MARRKIVTVLGAFLLAAGLVGLGATTASAASATQISAGDAHTCAVTTGGGAKCWGYNGNGELGDGGTTNRHAPVDVSGLTSGVAQVSAGGGHTCALTSGGGVKCWGLNGNGQLGDGTTTNRHAPVDVSGLTSGVAQISAGFYHTCALTTAGGVKCWGRNSYGELGDGSTSDSRRPVNVSGLGSGVAGISAGGYHTCALTTAGGVKCWGYNYYGQLGDGTTRNRPSPVGVSRLSSGATQVSAGYYHTCAVTTAGGAKCWGFAEYGQLGNGRTSTRTKPVGVYGLASGVARASAGGFHSCALTTGGGVKCWGLNTDGQLGDGTTRLYRTHPVDVSGLSSGIAAVSAGLTHTCAVTTGGGAKCWGDNAFGELGDGTTTDRHRPVNVSGLAGSAASARREDE